VWPKLPCALISCQCRGMPRCGSLGTCCSAWLPFCQPVQAAGVHAGPWCCIGRQGIPRAVASRLPSLLRHALYSCPYPPGRLNPNPPMCGRCNSSASAASRRYYSPVMLRGHRYPRQRLQHPDDARGCRPPSHVFDAGNCWRSPSKRAKNKPESCVACQSALLVSACLHCAQC
jgi:hypothetical protein